MSYRVIDEQDWQKYFNSVSQQVPSGCSIELDVAGAAFGDQVEERRAEFGGISYDPQAQTVYVHTPQLEHAISKPREVVAIEEGRDLRALSIRDADGNVQSIKFH